MQSINKVSTAQQQKIVYNCTCKKKISPPPTTCSVYSPFKNEIFITMCFTANFEA